MKLCNSSLSFCATQVFKELCKGVDEEERKKSLEGKKANQRFFCCILAMIGLATNNSCNAKKNFVLFFGARGGGGVWAFAS
jgi:hypothetical protein